ncbi:MAG: hypothetical protein AB7V44_02185 [Pseudonocardia sp.]
MALWSRTTIERWRGQDGGGQTAAAPKDVAVGEATVEDALPGDEPELGFGGEQEDGQDEQDDVPDGDLNEPGDHVAEGQDDPLAAGALTGDEVPGRPIVSGLDLQVGEAVFAKVKGEWRPARVHAVAHDSVAVQYSVGSGPLDERVLRLRVAAVRRP